MSIENIDTNIWVSQQTLADELNITVQRVHNWINREKIKAQAFPQLNNQVLVDKTSINIKTIK